MRYVVKDKSTGRFLRPTGEWTDYLSEAQLFPNGMTLPLHLEAMGAGNSSSIEILQFPIG